MNNLKKGTKLIVLIIVLLLALAITINILLTILVVNTTKIHMGERGLDIGEVVVTNIDGDRFQQVVLEGPNNEYYEELRIYLNEIREKLDLLYVYTESDIKDGVNISEFLIQWWDELLVFATTLERVF